LEGLTTFHLFFSKEVTKTMAVINKCNDKQAKNSRPAITPEGRENQMIALAIDLAEKQLKNGTASSQVVTHFLKMASTKERIEKEILEKQKELIVAKTEAIQSANKVEELYTKALDAMRSYSSGIVQPEVLDENLF